MSRTESTRKGRLMAGRDVRILVCTIAAMVMGMPVILTLLHPISPSLHSAGDSELRIVSLAPSVTEMLFALDLQHALVGVTNQCDYPPEAKGIAPVGGFRSPSVEAILTVRPTLVIDTALGRNEIAPVLRRHGIAVLQLSIGSFQELFESLRRVAAAANVPQRAEQVAAAMQSELDAVHSRWELIDPAKRPGVFIEIWGDPLTTVGGASFVDEVIRLAGGINVAHELNTPYAQIDPEKVIEWDPDVIITCRMGRRDDTTAEVSRRIGWAGITAVRTGRIMYDLPGDLILRAGPRLVEGVKMLAARLHDHTSDAVCDENDTNADANLRKVD